MRMGALGEMGALMDSQIEKHYVEPLEGEVKQLGNEIDTLEKVLSKVQKDEDENLVRRTQDEISDKQERQKDVKKLVDSWKKTLRSSNWDLYADQATVRLTREFPQMGDADDLQHDLVVKILDLLADPGRSMFTSKGAADLYKWTPSDLVRRYRTWLNNTIKDMQRYTMIRDKHIQNEPRSDDDERGSFLERQPGRDEQSGERLERRQIAEIAGQIIEEAWNFALKSARDKEFTSQFIQAWQHFVGADLGANANIKINTHIVPYFNEHFGTNIVTPKHLEDFTIQHFLETPAIVTQLKKEGIDPRRDKNRLEEFLENPENEKPLKRLADSLRKEYQNFHAKATQTRNDILMSVAKFLKRNYSDYLDEGYLLRKLKNLKVSASLPKRIAKISQRIADEQIRVALLSWVVSGLEDEYGLSEFVTPEQAVLALREERKKK